MSFPLFRAREEEEKPEKRREIRERAPLPLRSLSCFLTLDQKVAEASAGGRPALDRVRRALGRVALDRAAELGRHGARLVRARGGIGDGGGRRGGGAGAGHCCASFLESLGKCEKDVKGLSWRVVLLLWR